MVVRKKNLLDAFRQAAPEGRRAPAQETRSSKGGGPFASAPREAAPQPASLPVAREPAANDDDPMELSFETGAAEDRRTGIVRLVADPGFRLIVLVAVLIAAGAYAANRFGSKHVQAAGGVSNTGGDTAGVGVLSTGAAGQDAVEKNRAAAKMGTAAERALMDPENKFTVRLAQYKNDEAGRKKALATAEFLRKLAIPVIQPIEKGSAIILAAGAKPSVEDLAPLLKTIQAQHGPDAREKELPFASAYVQNIDALVQRR